MAFQFLLSLGLIIVTTASSVAQSAPEPTPEQQGKTAVAAPAAFEQLLTLAGDWVDVDGTLGAKGEVAATYQVTSNGSAVIETIFPGKPYEMVTVFYRDGDQIALTHYCSLGNQPQMRSVSLASDKMVFSLSGGSNFDPAVDRYMHSRSLRFISETEVEGEWQEYSGGQATPDLHKQYKLRRKL